MVGALAIVSEATALGVGLGMAIAYALISIVRGWLIWRRLWRRLPRHRLNLDGWEVDRWPWAELAAARSLWRYIWTEDPREDEELLRLKDTFRVQWQAFVWFGGSALVAWWLARVGLLS